MSVSPLLMHWKYRYHSLALNHCYYASPFLLSLHITPVSLHEANFKLAKFILKKVLPVSKDNSAMYNLHKTIR